MEYVVEIEFVVIPFRAFLYHMIMPPLEQWHILQLGSVPWCGIFRQTFKHKQGTDEGSAQGRGIDPQPVPVIGLSRDRIWQFIWRQWPIVIPTESWHINCSSYTIVCIPQYCIIAFSLNIGRHWQYQHYGNQAQQTAFHIITISNYWIIWGVSPLRP